MTTDSPSSRPRPALVPAAVPARRTQGVALISVLLLVVLISAILAVYTVVTINETRTESASHKSIQGFYAAEGGLNMRAELVRALFVGFNQPSGSGPSSSSPCTGNDTGSGDFACITYPFTGRKVSTYAAYSGASSGTVSTGPYTGLTYQQYAYDVHSLSYNSASSALESSLEMTFQSRLIPLFQFAAFYQRDLEFQPGANMTLNGRVATNSNLYLNANPGYSLQINGVVSAAGTVARAGKDGRTCNPNTVYLQGTAYNVACSVSSLTNNQLKSAYGGYLLAGQQPLTVPTMSSLAPVAGNELWDQADVRVVVRRTGASSFTPVVENADGSINYFSTYTLAYSKAVSMTTFADYREQATINVLQVDQQKLMNLIANGGIFDGSGKAIAIDDVSGGGLVWNFSFDDSAYSSTSAYTNDTSDALCAPNSNTSYISSQLANSCKRQYGVMIGNAATLGPSSSSSSKSIAGLSIVTNQPIYLEGDFNSNNKKPAAVMADAINVLSNSMVTTLANASTRDTYGYLTYDSTKASSSYATDATATTINAAFLSGIDDSVVGNTSQYNGGLQNYIRLHEDWSTNNVQLTYNGSFVSLGNSKHVGGLQTKARYGPPTRNWSYDTDFNTAANLPPLTPRAVYLRQQLFSRNYN